MPNPFNARASLDFAGGPATIFRLDALEAEGVAELDRLPFSIRVLLENVLRHAGNGVVDDDRRDSGRRPIGVLSPTGASRSRSCRAASYSRTLPGSRR